MRNWGNLRNAKSGFGFRNKARGVVSTSCIRFYSRTSTYIPEPRRKFIYTFKHIIMDFFHPYGAHKSKFDNVPLSVPEITSSVYAERRKINPSTALEYQNTLALSYLYLLLPKHTIFFFSYVAMWGFRWVSVNDVGFYQGEEGSYESSEFFRLIWILIAFLVPYKITIRTLDITNETRPLLKEKGEKWEIVFVQTKQKRCEKPSCVRRDIQVR